MTLKNLSIEELQNLIPQLSQKIPYLQMLILFGSRARGNSHAKSDWDFAVLYDSKTWGSPITPNPNRLLIYYEVLETLHQVFQINMDNIDLVTLNQCSPLLGFEVAKYGQLLYEQQPGEFIDFQVKAWKIYADSAKFRQAQRSNIQLWLQKQRLIQAN